MHCRKSHGCDFRGGVDRAGGPDKLSKAWEGFGANNMKWKPKWQIEYICENLLNCFLSIFVKMTNWIQSSSKLFCILNPCKQRCRHIRLYAVGSLNNIAEGTYSMLPAFDYTRQSKCMYLLACEPHHRQGRRASICLEVKCAVQTNRGRSSNSCGWPKT